MASHVLSFPKSSGSSDCKAIARSMNGDLFLEERRMDEAKGPQLIHSNRRVPGRRDRTSDSQVHARFIVSQVEREIAERVQRERAERSEVRRTVLAPDPCARQSRVPPQATDIGLRQRLQDALFLFLRLA